MSCMLEILDIARPVPNSSFSESQIHELYQQWKAFLLTTASDQKLDDNIPAQRQYNFFRESFPKIPSKETDQRFEHERLWIMNDNFEPTTPFVQHLRRQTKLMKSLQMCFRPVLTSASATTLTTADLISVLERYEFWLQNDMNRSLNVLGVSENSLTAQKLIERLHQSFGKYRFHVALLSESSHAWKVVLYDKVQHTFDYYDPRGRILDLSDQMSFLATTIAALHQAVMEQDERLVSNVSTKSQRGLTVNAQECLVSSLAFIHMRVARGRPFDEVTQAVLPKDKCQELLKVFFFVDKKAVEDKSKADVQHKELRTKFGAFDFRLAGLYLVMFLRQVRDCQHPDQCTLFNAMLEDFQKSLASPGDFQIIKAKGYLLQAELHKQQSVNVYYDSQPWVTAIRRVLLDPLTVKLRGKSQTKLKPTDRQQIGLAMWSELTQWIDLLPPDHPQAASFQEQVQKFMVSLVHVLKGFQDDHDQRYSSQMAVSKFLRETFSRQDSVAFGVELLRYAEYVANAQLKLKLETSLTAYPVPAELYAPYSLLNVQEARQFFSRCEQVIREAQQFIHTLNGQTLQNLAVQPSTFPIESTIQKVPSSSFSYDRPVSRLQQTVADVETCIRTNRVNFEKPQPKFFPLTYDFWSAEASLEPFGRLLQALESQYGYRDEAGVLDAQAFQRLTQSGDFTTYVRGILFFCIRMRDKSIRLELYQDNAWLCYMSLESLLRMKPPVPVAYDLMTLMGFLPNFPDLSKMVKARMEQWQKNFNDERMKKQSLKRIQEVIQFMFPNQE